MRKHQKRKIRTWRKIKIGKRTNPSLQAYDTCTYTSTSSYARSLLFIPFFVFMLIVPPFLTHMHGCICGSSLHGIHQLIVNHDHCDYVSYEGQRHHFHSLDFESEVECLGPRLPSNQIREAKMSPWEGMIPAQASRSAREFFSHFSDRQFFEEISSSSHPGRDTDDTRESHQTADKWKGQTNIIGIDVNSSSHQVRENNHYFPF